MGKVIDDDFPPASPCAYLGHARFAAPAARHDAWDDVYPINRGKVLAVSGGVPLAGRAPQRLAYRRAGLRR